MPEWLYVLGQVVLWILFGVAALFSFVIIMALGQYDFRPRQRKRQPRPAGWKANPPKGGSSVQPSRKARCSQYEALGGTPILRDGQVVGYQWGPGGIYGSGSPECSYEGPDGIGVSIRKLGTTLWLEDR
jgi:hypothetical protein